MKRNQITNAYHIGIKGEDMAVSYLKMNQYSILERRARSPYGEIDIICLDQKQDILVFVEVKSSFTSRNSFPYLAIKKKQMLRLKEASYYHAMMRYTGYLCNMRIDIIFILKNACKHIQNYCM